MIERNLAQHVIRRLMGGLSLGSALMSGGMTAAVLLAPAAVYAQAGGSLTVSGAKVIGRTTSLSSLHIAEGAALSAPKGKMLTLTVDGVERNIEPGRYAGAVVLTVTDDIPVKYLDLDPHHFRAALYIDNGRIVPSKSVRSAISGGTVGDTSADNIVIRSTGENFNGIVVDGTSRYTLNAPRIELEGNGGNDFAGFGAGIVAKGKAEVTLNNAKLTSHGAIRPALFVGGDATLHVNDSDIEVRNGVLPSDYVFDFALGKMKRVPWQLGMSGNVRALVLVDSGTVHYKRSRIRSEGWGALSIDAARRVRMYVEDSSIENGDSGYGAFSIGDSIAWFSNTKFDVADIGLVMAANGSGTFTNGTVVNSRRFGVMMFTYPRAGTLRIEGKSVFNTASTGIQVKGCGATILIDDAQINTGNGILLQAMIDDNDHQPGRPKPGQPYTKAPADPTVHAQFRNASLKGDVVNSRTAQGDLDLRLENATLVGRVSSAVQSPAQGRLPSEAEFRLIGDVKNSFEATDGAFGTFVSLDPRSSWTVTGTSYLTRLNIAPDAKLRAPEGHRLDVTVNGQKVDVSQAGSYQGAIVISVTKG